MSLIWAWAVAQTMETIPLPIVTLPLPSLTSVTGVAEPLVPPGGLARAKGVIPPSHNTPASMSSPILTASGRFFMFNHAQINL